jgi:hypothetical protein
VLFIFRIKVLGMQFQLPRRQKSQDMAQTSFQCSKAHFIVVFQNQILKNERGKVIMHAVHHVQQAET